MRYVTFIFVLVALLAFIAGGGCERKVTNEIVQDNTQFSGADACMSCHGDKDLKLVAAQAQWANSKHGQGETSILEGNVGDGACEKCHTGQGFIRNLDSTLTNDSAQYSGIGCFTCHSPHSTGTLALRVQNPIKMPDGSTFDHGEAKLCASCHQSRRNVHTYVADSVKLSQRFGPHHGPQGDMLNGTNGYEYAGYTYSNSAHSNVAVNGCINCHMSPSIGQVLGGHTWNMEAETVEGVMQNTVGCNVATCHNGEVEDLNFEGKQDLINDYVDSLGQALLGKGLAEISVDSSDAGFDTTLVPKTDRIVKSKDTTGAVWNWMYVKEDRSEGVHNTQYALDLLKSALNFIRTGDPNGTPGSPIAAKKD